MRKLKYIFLIAHLFVLHIAKAQDTLYFDEQWKETTRANHLYYRLLPLKQVGELIFIQDYYKNGHLQMQGYVHKTNMDEYVGDVYWYNDNSFDRNFVQYYNNSSVKELIYYHSDGSIWQRIKYNREGKKERIQTYIYDRMLTEGYIDSLGKLSGIFAVPQTSTHYERFYALSTYQNSPVPPPQIKKIETTTTTEEVILMPPAPPSPPKIQKPFFINTYWSNGNLAHERKYVYSDYYSERLLEDNSYDKDGKLLNSYTSEKNQPKTKIQYYTRNHVALSVKESSKYNANDILDGDNITYDIHGKPLTKTTYINGEIIQAQVYNNGQLLTTNHYQHSQPYNGQFEIDLGEVIQQFTLSNGQKVGEEVSLIANDKRVFAKGTYKNGKPWNGTFLTHEDRKNVLLENFSNGLRHGIQKEYNSTHSLILVEEFEMINGKKHGKKRQYNDLDNSIIAESLYENDEIISGTEVDDSGSIFTFANGKLVHEKIKSSIYEEDFAEEREYDTQGNLNKVTYYDFTINESPQKNYEGIYSKGKPYSGYFRIDTLVDDIRLIDYYENGTLKYKYSFDFLNQLENYRHYIYNEKTTYQNGKVIDGYTYQLVNDFGLLNLFYKDGELRKFDLNLFAIHYFARYSFALHNEKITILPYKVPNHLEIYKHNGTYKAAYFVDGKLAQESPELLNVKDGHANSVTVYYLKNNKTYKESIHVPQELKLDDQNDRITSSLFRLFPLKSEITLQQLFESFLKDIQDEFDGNFGNYIFQSAEYEGRDYLSTVEYDENGKIAYGIRVIENENKTYLLEGYIDNMLKKKVVAKSLQELLADDKKVLKDLSDRLLND